MIFQLSHGPVLPRARIEFLAAINRQRFERFSDPPVLILSANAWAASDENGLNGFSVQPADPFGRAQLAGTSASSR